MKSSDITYVFGTGRIDKLENKDFTAEFFYGYNHFKSKNLNIQIIEMDESKKNKKLSSKILFLLDKVLNKLSKLPFLSNIFISHKNRQISNMTREIEEVSRRICAVKDQT